MTLSVNGPDRVPWADRVAYSVAGKMATTFTPGASVPADLDRCPPDAFLNDAGKVEWLDFALSGP